MLKYKSSLPQRITIHWARRCADLLWFEENNKDHFENWHVLLYVYWWPLIAVINVIAVNFANEILRFFFVRKSSLKIYGQGLYFEICSMSKTHYQGLISVFATRFKFTNNISFAIAIYICLQWRLHSEDQD